MTWVLGWPGPIPLLWNSLSRFMIHLPKYLPLLVGFACSLAVTALAQEEKDEPLDNFDGSNREITVADPEAQKEKEASESGSGKILWGSYRKIRSRKAK